MFKIVFIRLQMVVIHIGDDCDIRRQAQERAVRFIRLGDEEAPLPEARIAAERLDRTPDHHRRIQPGGAEQSGNQTGRRGLAMGARHRDALTKTHQLRQHLGPAHHRNPRLKRREALDIVIGNRA